MMNKKYYCVISHTHWDREWYMPFEQFRIRLVELMDRLFEIIRKNPEFVFHLDAQTIVLEDYLEIRPYRRELLKKHITEGNIVVGPWYLQNDFYLTSGESTIRNLLTGIRIAEEFGACGKAGYAPDQFGNISQLPQILNQFGIDNFIFGRGYGAYRTGDDGKTTREQTPAEFIWEGPDGSRLLAVHMKYWYNNAQRIYSNPDAALDLLKIIEKSFDGVAVTPYLLLMNGVDHLEAQDDLLRILNEIGPKLPENREIRQYHMDEFIDQVRDFCQNEKTELAVHHGELRDGHDWELLKGTLSSRAYLKQLNCKAQTALEGGLEPLSSLYELADATGSYDRDLLRHFWKQLMKNHPHDSICGCSRDEVHDHMEDNYARLKEAVSYLTDKKLQDLAWHMEANTKNPEENLIALINPVSVPQGGVVEVEVTFLLSEQVEAFRIFDINGEEQEFYVLSVTDKKLDVFTALNLPGVLDVRVFTLMLSVPELQGFTAKGLIVRKSAKWTDKDQNFVPKLDNELPRSIDNGRIRAEVSEKGEISISWTDTGTVIENALQIEELPDPGDAYVFFKTTDTPINGSQFPCSVTRKEQNPLRQKLSVSYAMEVPEEYDFKNRKRSAKTVLCPVELILTVTAGSDVLEIEARVDNTAKDHRIRLLANTGICSGQSSADIPFDIVTHPAKPSFPDTMSDVHPNSSFAAIGDDRRGIVVFTEGNQEYEHLLDQNYKNLLDQNEENSLHRNSILAFTLVRSTGAISRTADLEVGGGAQWEVPGNQCLRSLSGRFGIGEFGGNQYLSLLPARAQIFRTPIVTKVISCDPVKFAKGRFAIQGSTLEEYYFLPDLYPDLKIPDQSPVLTVKGEGILVTALKKAEEGENFVVRLFNPGEAAAPVQILYHGRISRTTLSEKPQGIPAENRMEFRMTPKEIATFFLEP